MLLADVFATLPDRMSGMIVDPVMTHEVKRMATMARAIARACRIVLSESATHAAQEALLSRPSSMLDALIALRLDPGLLWLEIDDAARRAKSRELGTYRPNGRPEPSRVGWLIDVDASGRAGSLRVAWSHELTPSYAPLLVHFDFRHTLRPPPAETRGEIYDRWRDDPREWGAMMRLDQHVSVDADPWSLPWLESIARVDPVLSAFILDAAGDDIAGEALMALAILLLRSAQGAVRIERESRARLNAARRRHGRSLLLDHEIMHLVIAPWTKGLARAGGPSGPRRLHVVRGHFVRRGMTIFWRRAHLRGGHRAG